jgi:hypothetical protein
MAETTQDVQTAAPDATGEMPQADAANGATPTGAEPTGEKQTFVPFFNPEYEFRLGTFGDLGSAYRLGAIFIFMLAAAAMMYLAAWWWVGTHPLAQHN